MSATNLATFTIDTHRLKFGKNLFEFHINSANFQSLENSLIEKGTIHANLVLDKSETMIKAIFNTTGTVELVCDRTLKPFNFEIKTENTIYYKFSDHYEEISDEITLINEHTSEMNFLIPIYEFIVLAIPIKKIHPELIHQEDDELNDNILVYSSLGDIEETTDTHIDILDPRWEALKKLKDSL